MGNNCSALGQLNNRAGNFIETRGILNHFVGYAGKACDEMGDITFRVYKGDILTCNSRTVVKVDGNFGNFFPERAASCRFNVNYCVHFRVTGFGSQKYIIFTP